MRTSFWLLFLLLVAGVAFSLVKGNDPYIGLLGTPDVVTFTAAPDVVPAGHMVTLSWNVRGAASIAIDFGPEDQPRAAWEHHGGLPARGSLRVKPVKTSNFAISCDTVANLDCQPHVISVEVKGSKLEVPTS